MFWVGLLVAVGGVGMMMSKKESTGISIGGHDVQKEVGKEYGQGCATIIVGAILMYFGV